MEEINMWSELPFDLLAIICKDLPLLDFVSFSSVCRTWRDVCSFTKYNRFEAPWLLYSGGEHEPKTANFYIVSDRTPLKIHNQPGLPLHTRLYIGSSHGWLITADEKSELSLLNPLTKQQIDLPPILTFGCFLPIRFDLDGHVSSYIFRGERGPDYIYTSEELRRHFFDKATLTHSPSLSDDYAVVLVLYEINCIAFARHGDEKWTTIAHRNVRVGISCHIGVVYTIIWTGEVESWDFSQKHYLPEQPVTYVPEDKRSRNPYCFYLVPAPWGDMLHIRRLRNAYEPYLTRLIEVFTVDPESKKLIQARSIGDHAIFIGNNQPICISCEQNPNLKRNSVYFTDDDGETAYHKELIRDMGIYDLKDGSVERIFEHPLLKWPPPPIWFQPSLI